MKRLLVVLFTCLLAHAAVAADAKPIALQDCQYFLTSSYARGRSDTFISNLATTLWLNKESIACGKLSDQAKQAEIYGKETKKRLENNVATASKEAESLEAQYWELRNRIYGSILKNAGY